MVKTTEQKKMFSTKQQKKITTKSKYNFSELFPIVEASMLSLEDKFLKHNPETVRQVRLKKSIINAIKLGGYDFRHHIIDPSEDSKGNIIFREGNRPAVGNSTEWWNEKAQSYMPVKNSRLGIKREYDMFLGVLIKELIEEQGYHVREAWY